jgi:hypothetical protein
VRPARLFVVLGLFDGGIAAGGALGARISLESSNKSSCGFVWFQKLMGRFRPFFLSAVAYSSPGCIPSATDDPHIKQPGDLTRKPRVLGREILKFLKGDARTLPRGDVGRTESRVARPAMVESQRKGAMTPLITAGSGSSRRPPRWEHFTGLYILEIWIDEILCNSKVPFIEHFVNVFLESETFGRAQRGHRKAFGPSRRCNT